MLANNIFNIGHGGGVNEGVRNGNDMRGIEQGGGKLPSNRQALNEDLINRGFYCKGQTPGGYVEYAHPDGTKVWIRPDGEVITIKREWLPDMSKKIDVRYQWDGTPVPNGGHNTGEFVESISEGTFVPQFKGK